MRTNRMKALLLALIINVVSAGHKIPSDVIFSQSLEKWKTIAIVADNEDKITEGGPLRLYARHFECSEVCEEATFTFYVKSNGECQKHVVVGKRNEDDIYEADYSGYNSIEILKSSKKLVMIFNINKDEEGKTTREILILGKTSTLSREEEMELEKLAEERDIRKENLQYIHESDTCPL